MAAVNPVNEYLRTDRIPHIWCSGCGLGTTVNCFVRAVQSCGIPRDDIAVVSGIGCTGRVAGYLKLDSFHTTHGRPIPFATGLKLANPKLNVVVYSGDGDLFAIGGNHFIHAARRNIDLTIICINNFTYGMTGGQLTPTTPVGAIASTSPYGNVEEPFNLPHLAESAGDKDYEGSHAEAGLQLRRDRLSLPHSLRKKKPVGGWARHHAILQGKQHGQKWRRYARS